MPSAIKLAERMCRNGPLAMRTAKEIAVRALDLEPGFVLEKALGLKVLNSADAKERGRRVSKLGPASSAGEDSP